MQESVVWQVVGGVAVLEAIKYLVQKYLRKADTEYRTVDDCEACERHLDDEKIIGQLRQEMLDQKKAEERTKDHLREEIRAMKRVLFMMAEKQGIPSNLLQELIR